MSSLKHILAQGEAAARYYEKPFENEVSDCEALLKKIQRALAKQGPDSLYNVREIKQQLGHILHDLNGLADKDIEEFRLYN